MLERKPREEDNVSNRGENMKLGKIRCCCLSTLTAFLLLTLVVFEQANAIRTSPEEYWKEMMKGEPIPPAIKDHLVDHKYSTAPAPAAGNNDEPTTDDYANWDHWDLDPRSTAIIYHHQDFHVDHYDPQGHH